MIKRNKLKKITLITFLISTTIGINNISFAQNQNNTNINNYNPEAEYKKGLNSVLSSNVTSQAINVSIEEVTKIRQNILKDTASNYGITAGLSWKMNQIKINELSQLEDRLNKFDFSSLAIDAGVLPPVIIEGVSNYAQNNDDEVRLADKSLKIEKPAKFYSTYPTWRDYLVFDFPAPEAVPVSILPKTPAESKIWDYWVEKGFAQGVLQAKNIFQASIDRFDRDYNGMLKFHQLLAQNQITPTLVSKHNMGITGGGRELRINDQILRIQEHSALISDDSKWRNTYPITYKDSNGQYK